VLAAPEMPMARATPAMRRLAVAAEITANSTLRRAALANDTDKPRFYIASLVF
jgi:hypothetical protein